MNPRSLLVLAVALFAATQSEVGRAASGHHHHHATVRAFSRVAYYRPVRVIPSVYYAVPPVYYAPPPAYYEPPVTYIEQPPAIAAPPAATGPYPITPDASTRYFCPELRRFYPEVTQCRAGWMKVLPGRVANPG